LAFDPTDAVPGVPEWDNLTELCALLQACKSLNYKGLTAISGPSVLAWHLLKWVVT